MLRWRSGENHHDHLESMSIQNSKYQQLTYVKKFRYQIKWRFGMFETNLSSSWCDITGVYVLVVNIQERKRSKLFAYYYLCNQKRKISFPWIYWNSTTYMNNKNNNSNIIMKFKLKKKIKTKSIQSQWRK